MGGLLCPAPFAEHVFEVHCAVDVTGLRFSWLNNIPWLRGHSSPSAHRPTDAGSFLLLDAVNLPLRASWADLCF